MNLDARTLLFSLILADILMALCLVVAAHGQVGEKKRDGLNKWATVRFTREDEHELHGNMNKVYTEREHELQTMVNKTADFV